MSPRRIREGESRKQKTPNFEASFQELEDTVSKLEQGDLPLEESIVLYERGIALASQLEKTLEEADLRVRKLAPTDASDITLSEYDIDEE